MQIVANDVADKHWRRVVLCFFAWTNVEYYSDGVIDAHNIWLIHCFCAYWVTSQAHSFVPMHSGCTSFYKTWRNFDIKIHQEGTNHQSPHVADLRRLTLWVHSDVSWCNLKFSELLTLYSLIREDVGNSFGLSFWRNLLMWRPTLSNLQ